MKFSVVIPTYNRAATLRQTLTALMAQDYPDYEIIVVDDGSTDDTRAMIAREFPQVRYIYQQNRGPAAARNRGIAHARGEIIAFTDDDCVPPRDWLARLADGYARYPDVVGVGGYLEAPDEVLQRALLARYERFIARRVFRVSASTWVGLNVRRAARTTSRIVVRFWNAWAALTKRFRTRRVKTPILNGASANWVRGCCTCL